MATGRRVVEKVGAALLAAAAAWSAFCVPARAQSCDPQDFWNALQNAASSVSSPACDTTYADPVGDAALIALAAALGGVMAEDPSANVCGAISNAFNDLTNGQSDLGTLSSTLGNLGVASGALDTVQQLLSGAANPVAAAECACQWDQGVGALGGDVLACLQSAICAGLVVGVAPQASLLNIKVVERLPGTGSTPAAQCEAGTATGLLSWVLQGIQDAISNHANIINASLGTLIDSTTGDGAGWIAQMNAVTYAAAQSGVVIVAAAGNDGLDLSTSKYVDLPGQARGVLTVVASTNPACAENLLSNAVCVSGPVTRTYYSNHGTNLNAIAAPGGSLPGGTPYGVSGFVRGACSNGLPNTTDGLPGTPGQSFGCFNVGHQPYIQAIGTSAAAPLVAGAAAILKAAHPTWTPTQIISVLQSTATTVGNMTEPELNLPAALGLQTTP